MSLFFQCRLCCMRWPNLGWFVVMRALRRSVEWCLEMEGCAARPIAKATTNTITPTISPTLMFLSSQSRNIVSALNGHDRLLQYLSKEFAACLALSWRLGH